MIFRKQLDLNELLIFILPPEYEKNNQTIICSVNSVVLNAIVLNYEQQEKKNT